MPRTCPRLTKSEYLEVSSKHLFFLFLYAPLYSPGDSRKQPRFKITRLGKWFIKFSVYIRIHLESLVKIQMYPKMAHLPEILEQKVWGRHKKVAAPP